MRPSLDPLRYGLRALDEMAREQASVAPPAPSRAETFSPHPLLRAPARDGAALSLRLFTEAEDDATALVLGDASSQRLSPIPPRAAPLFEAHAAAMAAEVESSITIGFPLVMFVQQGAMRAAPLFSRGGSHARWRMGEAAWKLPAGARPGATLPLPDALDLVLGSDEPYALHAGVWHFLFGLDGAALGAIAAAGRAGVGALVRAATRALDSGGEEVGDDEVDAEPLAAGPLTREDLAAIGEAAVRRAPPSRGLRCHPHGLAMLPPRGDPTSGLRSDLQAVLGETLPPRGPLAVYLGARAAPPRQAPIYTTGKVSPTPSQLAAARAFEGSEDLVAVCGPPGCGKTALLHHVAAQTIVACALGKRWTSAPSRAAAWSLVVTSTNNAAVDHALAPFVAGPGLPVGLRLGNRRALAESTGAALAAVFEELRTAGDVSLADARAAFEARAAPVRAFQREQEASHKSSATAAARRRTLERRAATLREELAQASDAPPPNVELADLDAAAETLREHAEAAARLAPIHLDGKSPSVERASEKWARANALRAPRIEPVLVALGLGMPCGDLDRGDARADITRQHAAIEAALASVAAARSRLTAPALRGELDAVTAELGVASGEPVAPPLDPGLYDAALALRDAWARAHREVLLPRLTTARDAARAEWTEARGKPVPQALRELAALFPVAGCTLLSMRASFPLGADVIDRLVIDEAAQCAPIYAVPALARARRVMLTGDLAQLPPVYTLAPHTDDRLARGLDEAAVAPFRMSATSTASAQAVAEPRARARLTLTEHFRSQHAI
ncbi:MAG TPA: AAA domain-containing protein, partial [Labilithrix sp.]|nr:AAA domain-containing protein [Labilithrix sp.]